MNSSNRYAHHSPRSYYALKYWYIFSISMLIITLGIIATIHTWLWIETNKSKQQVSYLEKIRSKREILQERYNTYVASPRTLSAQSSEIVALSDYSLLEGALNIIKNNQCFSTLTIDKTNTALLHTMCSHPGALINITDQLHESSLFKSVHIKECSWNNSSIQPNLSSFEKNYHACFEITW